MWRKVILMMGLLLVLVSCAERQDPETLTLSLNPGVDTIQVGSTYEEPGAVATLGGQNHTVSVVENTLDTDQVGSYRIVYETQYRGTVKRVVRHVDVIDTTPPVLTLNPGIDTVYLNSHWIDAGVSVTDNSGLEVTVEIDGEVVISMAGEYRITYVATDAFGNQAEIVRFVHVIHPSN